MPIYEANWTSYVSYITESAITQDSYADQARRIKEIVIYAFNKLRDFFSRFDQQSNEINMKAIAMISCLSLIALLVISILRRNDSQLIPPPTPLQNY